MCRSPSVKLFLMFHSEEHVRLREERIRTVSNYELSSLVQHSYMSMANTRSLYGEYRILKEV